MLFFIPQFACVSWGWGSADWPYRLVFAAGIPFLLLSMAGEKYCAKNLAKMGTVGVLAAWAYLQNGNRSLILACMAVYGIKGINIKKVLKWAFWTLLICMSFKILLCAAGLLPNESVYLPKENGIYYTIYCYGYDTPNNLFFHLVTAVLLAMVLYGEIFRWPAVASVTLFMYGAYRVLLSRTGWMCFLGLLILYLAFCFLRKKGAPIVLKGLLWLLSFCPVILCLLNIGLVYLQGTGIYGIEMAADWKTILSE